MDVLKNKNFRIVLAIVVMAVMGGSLVGPVLPAMVEPLDVSRANIGWIMSVYTFTALVFTPVFGIMADRVGRKNVLVPCVIAYGISGTAIAFAGSFWLVLLLRFVQGVCVAGLMNLGVALIGDLFEGNTRARAMGYRISAQNFANALVPFIAGGLAAIAWNYPFFIYSLAILVGVLVILKLDIPDIRSTQNTSSYLIAALNIVKHHRALWIFSGGFILFVLLFSIIVYIPMMVTDVLELSTAYAGFAVSLAAATSGVVATQSGKLRKRYEPEYIVLTGFIVAGLALFLLSFVQSYVVLLSFLIIWGSGFALVMPTLSTLATEQAPPNLRAGVVSVFSMTIYLGQTVSPPLFGKIMQFTDINTIFRYGCIIALLPVIYTIIEIWIAKKKA